MRIGIIGAIAGLALALSGCALVPGIGGSRFCAEGGGVPLSFGMVAQNTGGVIVTSLAEGGPEVLRDLEGGFQAIVIEDYEVLRSGLVELVDGRPLHESKGPLGLTVGTSDTMAALAKIKTGEPVAFTVINSVFETPWVTGAFALSDDGLTYVNECAGSTSIQAELDRAVEQFRADGGEGDLFEALAGPIIDAEWAPLVEAEPADPADPSILSQNGERKSLRFVFESDHTGPVLICLSQGESDLTATTGLYCSIEGSAGGNEVSFGPELDLDQDLTITVRDASTRDDVKGVLGTISLDPSLVVDAVQPVPVLVLEDGELTLLG